MKGSRRIGQPLGRALSLLLPDVFFHPVWTHFVEVETPLAPQRIQLLLDAVDQMLSAGNPGDACRILFICTFQQLRAGDYAAASSNIQRILVLAEQHGLPQVAWWATWGAAAVCVRRGWFQQAAEHLEHLQSILSQPDEWVLSGMIDMTRQALLSQAQADVAAVDQMPSSEAVLASTLKQLQEWGAPPAVREVGDYDSAGGGRTTLPSHPAGFNWRSVWQTIRHVVKGELRLKWVEPEGPAQVAYADQGRLSVAHPPLPAAPVESPAAEEPAVGWDATLGAPDTDRTDSAAGPRPALTLTVYTLGSFHLAVNDTPTHRTITGKSRMVFAYMLLHHEQAMSRDVLMDVLWPDAGPESARNRLNVALHHVRQALRGITDVPVVLYEDGAYSINPEFDLWTDADEFERHVRKGRQLEAANRLDAAIKEYELARDLYQGDFMTDEPYEDWPVLTRERLRTAYLDILDRLSRIYFDREEYTGCVMLCQAILMRDNCREDAHCLLMRCYCRQGQYNLALRQYQACVEALSAELEVEPTPETTQLYERIRRRERV